MTIPESEDITHKRAVSAAFGAMAPFYDSWYQTPVGNYVWSVEKMALRTMLPTQVNGIMIDIGVGTGLSLNLLRSFSTQIIGIDIAWQMVKLAHQKSYHYSEIHLIVADGEKLPFRQNIAELVLGMTVLEFLPKPNKLLQEIHKCLHPKGWLILGVLTSINLWALERRIRNLIKPDVFRLARFPSPWQIRRMLYQNGFSKSRYRGSVYAPTFTPSKCFPRFIQLDAKLGTRWISRSLGAFLVVQTQCVEAT